ncbi:hypothetical protein CNMCM6936_005824 [Aspergillus lentulus]|nr:hypothetical protein CNMCM6936_005824 [Aspergillus lentulus]
MDQLDGIHFADGFDEKDGLPRLRKLLDSKWNISSDGKGIEKKFHFKNHTNVLDFVHYIGVKCKRKNHHPEAIMTQWYNNILAIMSYTIRLRIENGTSDTLTVVEKTCWYYANGSTWTEKDGEHVLFMGGSGTSGMLRFKTSSGDFFTVVLGMHNYNPWSGLLVNLREDDTALKLHPEYYNGGKFSSLTPDAAYTPPTAHGKNVWITWQRKDENEVFFVLHYHPYYEVVHKRTC